jgi:hypothetical protein
MGGSSPRLAHAGARTLEEGRRTTLAKGKTAKGREAGQAPGKAACLIFEISSN